MKTSIGQDLCPSCGRFSGTLTKCEYCDCAIPSTSLRRIGRQWLAVSSVLGLIFLFYAGRGDAVRSVPVYQIQPSMNHALIKVAGRLVSKPYIANRRGASAYVSFLLEDGGSSVRICMKGADAEMFVREAVHIEDGVQMEVVGVLRVRAGDDPKVYVRSTGDAQAWKVLP